jgi:hypothetical protein
LEKQNSAIQWMAMMLGIENIPSHNTMKEIDTALQNACGIQSICYAGPLGHIYYTNDLPALIAQVFHYV